LDGQGTKISAGTQISARELDGTGTTFSAATVGLTLTLGQWSRGGDATHPRSPHARHPAVAALASLVFLHMFLSPAWFCIKPRRIVLHVYKNSAKVLSSFLI